MLLRRSRRRFYGGRTGHDSLFRGEIEEELTGNWLEQPALMPEGDAVPGGCGAGLQQRILHTRHLLLHGFQRLPDDRGPDLLRAQVADFLDLQEVEKRIALRDGHQSGFFPTRQLARREPKYAEQVLSTVTVHDCKEF